MKNSELKSLSVEELNARLAAEKESLQKLKFAHAVTPVENPMRIRHNRRVVARIQTELHSRELSK
ncbi:MULTISPECIES: 50S ribosomal protein L29 [Imperialibacter]|jgi:large subunit ribosomal protein L29|uniref:Large ribosomal subunit protein uL29 n=1 Tax=Imperialibacter roseus TaxID=1324217 RepID=A0ABZ0ILY0_9BACT|nr:MULTISPECIES: 50S ribosomal protein L29 [Imperialibacter]WOK05189.1 50S ribosomal protein L29 [Imperialibacter roseus]|tara:strand:- start:815 stop:1009 length:195 start_codon:yes stop_codon:yes gene_type:complete